MSSTSRQRGALFARSGDGATAARRGIRPKAWLLVLAGAALVTLIDIRLGFATRSRHAVALDVAANVFWAVAASTLLFARASWQGPPTEHAAEARQLRPCRPPALKSVRSAATQQRASGQRDRRHGPPH